MEYKNASEEGKQLIEDKYKTHLTEKDLSRKEREKDKEENKLIVSFDLQATLPCPLGNASSFYYTSKLNVYNLTFVSSTKNDVVCYIWHEGEANRGANEIGSCVWHYLNGLKKKALIEENKMVDVTFYTDNCSGQNKNKFLYALYLSAVSVLPHINSIMHKYLIRGHTQNDAENVHSVIEKQISRYKKAAAIYAPDQYVTLIRQAKKTGQPYVVEELSHGDFKDLKDLSEQMAVKELYKNENGDLVKTSDIKVFEVRKKEMGCFFYKTSYKDCIIFSSKCIF
ncbi:unnamed protein product [Ceutorhynchus assimilis]|uniref:DUF7869 domain-containing protein n=1 Tax=Ceutorhynchus assimilis TaxID=467358 RepID=A0A9N9MTU8_9CUCU|nr:unnamed protein product [Ceutorhynchus assimilis]